MLYDNLSTDELVALRWRTRKRVEQIERSWERHSLDGQKELRQKRAALRSQKRELDKRIIQQPLF